jgi:ubiquinone/menaquinone biosynthesis C-methylase UbiE
MTNLPAGPRILDIGCGPGKQTLDLAGLGNGSIVALDICWPFLVTLQEKIKSGGLGERVICVRGSMDSLPQTSSL